MVQGYWGITLHFLFHGCHHKFPTDALRLVFPPLPAAAIAAGIWGSLRACLCQVWVQYSPRCLTNGEICILQCMSVTSDMVCTWLEHACHHALPLPQVVQL